MLILSAVAVFSSSCSQGNAAETETKPADSAKETEAFYIPDTTKIPNDKFGVMVKYGRDLFFNTAYYIGPDGTKGKYLGNKMNCVNCHQDAGTKPFSLNLVRSHTNYPQYRSREARVLSLAERVNNCVMRPHNGKPLPLDSKEMIAFLSYLQWINSKAPKEKMFGEKNLKVEFPDRAADPEKGKLLYVKHCQRCHGENGEGKMRGDNVCFEYPPLWGPDSYQPGSSMHRVIKQAQWIKANMPQDIAKWNQPVLTDEEALDVAAFVNDDRIHSRPNPVTFDYPNPEEKAIDYGKGPFIDSFSEQEHKFGPYPPIIKAWKDKGLKPSF